MFSDLDARECAKKFCLIHDIAYLDLLAVEFVAAIYADNHECSMQEAFNRMSECWLEAKYYSYNDQLTTEQQKLYDSRFYNYPEVNRGQLKQEIQIFTMMEKMVLNGVV